MGTLAALGTAGLTVRDALAARLELGVAPTAWHTTRDSLAEVVSYLANLTASLGKIGQDILLLRNPMSAKCGSVGRRAEV